jgi:hypothetical protein
MREKSQLNVQVLQSLNQLQREMKKVSNEKPKEEGRFHEIREDCGRVGHSRSARRNHRHHSPP